MPTYRFDRSVFDPQGKRIYSEEKMRVPSWTDRVLWRGLPNCPIEVMKYDAVNSVATRYVQTWIPSVTPLSQSNFFLWQLSLAESSFFIYPTRRPLYIFNILMIFHSDHSPVFCTFSVSARLAVPMWNSLHDKTPFIPSEGKEVFVKFYGLRAHQLKHLKEKGKKKDPNPYIKFIAPFLPNDQKWKTSIAKKVRKLA